MKIAILYICTGKYTVFWDDFFLSCEKYFLKDSEKHYFVFTDGEISSFDNKRIHRIEQKNLGWPGNTLYRFKMFYGIKEKLADFDYIFFFNANCEFLTSIETDFLPSKEEGIVVVQHPGFFNKTPDLFSYDRNPESKAFIPAGKGSYYICGGINGGHTLPYLNLIKSLNDAIEQDDSNGIVALWHDESHINKYIQDHPYKLQNPSYCYPEYWDIPFEKIILIRSKDNYGGIDALRGLKKKKKKNILIEKIKGKICRLLSK